MIYTEKELGRYWPLILLTAISLIFLPQIALFELSGTEAAFSQVAQDLTNGQSVGTPSLQGQYVDTRPLYPILISLFSFGASPNDISVHLPSILGLLIMCFSAAWVTFRHSNRQAAAVAGLIVLSSYASLRFATKAEPHLLGAALISCSWLTLYEISRDTKNWHIAWLSALGFSFLGYLCIGAHSFFFFYFPLLFLRRPTDIRKRLLKAPHLIAFTGLCLLTFLYFSHNHNFVKNTGAFSLNAPFSALWPDSGYLFKVLRFPFTCFTYLLPWAFFAWAPYCEALRPLEKDKVLYHYLRTITVSLFLIICFLPGAGAENLLPLLSPIAIMIALHYSILIRRHRVYFELLQKYLLGLNVLAILGLFGSLAAIHFKKWSIPVEPKTLQWILISLACALIINLFFFTKPVKNLPAWLKILVATVLLFWSIQCFKSLPRHGHQTQRQIAQEFLSLLPQNASIYSFPDKEGKSLYYPLAHYLNQPVKMILSEDNDEKWPQTIYVITQDKTPSGMTKNPAFFLWEASSKVYIGPKGQKCQLWKGTVRK